MLVSWAVVLWLCMSNRSASWVWKTAHNIMFSPRKIQAWQKVLFSVTSLQSPLLLLQRTRRNQKKTNLWCVVFLFNLESYRDPDQYVLQCFAKLFSCPCQSKEFSKSPLGPIGLWQPEGLFQLLQEVLQTAPWKNRTTVLEQLRIYTWIGFCAGFANK